MAVPPADEEPSSLGSSPMLKSDAVDCASRISVNDQDDLVAFVIVPYKPDWNMQ